MLRFSIPGTKRFGEITNDRFYPAVFFIASGLSRMLLELLHLADSALPVGATAHSFGVETLVEQENLLPETVETFLCDYLSEAGAMEASFVRRAWQGDCSRLLSDEFGARRPARESRDAALKMGRRFALLVNAILGESAIPDNLYYPVAFGLAAARLQIPEDAAAVAYLRQSVAGLVSACQRLMPIGQVEASCIVWNLRTAVAAAAVTQNGAAASGADFSARAARPAAPAITATTPDSVVRPGRALSPESARAATRGAREICNSNPSRAARPVRALFPERIREVACFTPLPELASARHGSLETRLFIS